MQVERVQKWIISALVLTTAAHFAGGLVLLALTVDNPGAFPVLITIATIVCLLAIVGTRVINQMSLLTPWLIAGFVPLALGLYFA
ncbi:hypothetical protein [Nocardioides campestrisoli]|uniref:hypothetical protein n=1 Tax=Nocardioides campestrisoli TaxID=2736757 RepID=UPI0015E77B52|nr:hypothetical protein [Nocardioides campestrisoli]